MQSWFKGMNNLIVQVKHQWVLLQKKLNLLVQSYPGWGTVPITPSVIPAKSHFLIITKSEKKLCFPYIWKLLIPLQIYTLVAIVNIIIP